MSVAVGCRRGRRPIGGDPPGGGDPLGAGIGHRMDGIHLRVEHPWTPMKFGPMTFQWMCLSVSAVSIRAVRRSCSADCTVSASVALNPGA